MWRLLSVLLILETPYIQAPDITIVIQRATEYVTRYEEELGNLIGSEDYVQNVAWKNAINQPGVVTKREQRRTYSDFLIVQVGSDWQALRKTNRLDGRNVKETQANFETAFEESPAANTRRINQMKVDSTLYNIGPVLRDINLPTFALRLFRKNQVSRFQFQKTAMAKVDGISTWIVAFKEIRGPTLVHGTGDQDLISHGRLWIEPDSGRVLKTEFAVESRFEDTSVEATIVVTYGRAKNLTVLVPTVMVEHYEGQFSSINCRAEYSNFRRFEVDVKFDIAPPKPPGP
jgi:hypothetical protein